MIKHFSVAILIKGVSGLVAQILLLRELLIVFSGNELSIGVILANWLILGAFGSYILGRRAERSKYSLEVYTVITILFFRISAHSHLPGAHPERRNGHFHR